MVQSGNRSPLRPKSKAGAQVIKVTLNASTFSAIISKPSLASEQEHRCRSFTLYWQKQRLLKRKARQAFTGIGVQAQRINKL